MPPRRVPQPDDEIPELPPMDGDDGDETIGPVTDGPDEGGSPASLDDTAADDLPIDDDVADDDDDATHDPLDDEEGTAGTEDDADEIEDDDGGRWTGADPTDATDAEGIDVDESEPGEDHGEDGPVDDASSDLEVLPPLDDDGDEDADDEGEGNERSKVERRQVALAGNDAAFALPPAPAVVVRRLRGDGPMQAAALGAERLLIVGESLWSVALDALADHEVSVAALDAPDGEVFCSVVEDPAGTLFLGTATGRVYRRARHGTWELVRRSGEGRAAGPVDALFADGWRVWARTRGGAVLRVEDGIWRDGVGLDDPISALTVDDAGVVLVVRERVAPALRFSNDGGRTWRRMSLPGREAPWLLARAGETLAIAPGTGAGPGRVSIDHGRSWAAWSVMKGATALALTETDDGVPLVVFATYDAAEDRAVVVCARVSANGMPVDPRRLCLIERAFEEAPSGEGDESACRVEALVPLDRAGRRIVVVAARQVVLVERGG